MMKEHNIYMLNLKILIMTNNIKFTHFGNLLYKYLNIKVKIIN